jgi:hypothetical protein
VSAARDDDRPAARRAPGRAPGLGDRWMAGETLPGIDFAQHARVVVRAGTHAGTMGTVLLLVAVTPEPRYAVRLDDVAGAPIVRLAQDALTPAS